MVCQNQVLWLSPKYNVMQAYAKNYKYTQSKSKPTAHFFASPYSTTELIEAESLPVIIHYIPSSKPWFYGSKHPLAYLYMRYIKLTPWRDFKFQDRAFKKIVKYRTYKFKFYCRYVLDKLKSLP